MQQVLEPAGLDRDSIRGALDREFEHSPSAAGVSLAALDLPLADDRSRRVVLGTSSKLAFERGFRGDSRSGKYLRPANILLVRATIRRAPGPRHHGGRLAND